MRLCGISSRFQLLSPCIRQVTHALLTRPPLSHLKWINPQQAGSVFGRGASFDLHVLSTPPAFILSQDQTLVKSVCSVRMTLAIHPLLLFWKSLVSITRINNVRSENICLNFQGWLLFNYQCSFCCLFATACLLYLTCSRLSTTFLFFFFKNFCRFSTARIIYHNFLCLSTTFKNSFLLSQRQPIHNNISVIVCQQLFFKVF